MLPVPDLTLLSRFLLLVVVINVAFQEHVARAQSLVIRQFLAHGGQGSQKDSCALLQNTVKRAKLSILVTNCNQYRVAYLLFG